MEHLTRELCSGTNDGPNIRNEIRTIYWVLNCKFDVSLHCQSAVFLGRGVNKVFGHMGKSCSYMSPPPRASNCDSSLRQIITLGVDLHADLLNPRSLNKLVLGIRCKGPWTTQLGRWSMLCGYRGYAAMNIEPCCMDTCVGEVDSGAVWGLGRAWDLQCGWWGMEASKESGHSRVCLIKVKGLQCACLPQWSLEAGPSPFHCC